MAIYKPGSKLRGLQQVLPWRLQRELASADTWTPDLRPPELGDDTLLSSWYLVTAVQVLVAIVSAPDALGGVHDHLRTLLPRIIHHHDCVIDERSTHFPSACPRGYLQPCRWLPTSPDQQHSLTMGTDIHRQNKLGEPESSQGSLPLRNNSSCE